MESERVKIEKDIERERDMDSEKERKWSRGEKRERQRKWMMYKNMWQSSNIVLVLSYA